jgi:ABC-type hemin transport system substrate-binding protein
MAITRALLHLSKIDDFARWAAQQGWVREPNKGYYEVLRLRKEGRTKRGRRKPMIFYRRHRGDHVTIGGDQAQGHSLVKRWLRERNAADDNEMEAIERDAVLEMFGEDGLLYEDATGKTLGDK